MGNIGNGHYFQKRDKDNVFEGNKKYFLLAKDENEIAENSVFSSIYTSVCKYMCVCVCK